MSSSGPLIPLAICDTICHAASSSEPLGLPIKTLASPSLPNAARRLGLGGMRVAYIIRRGTRRSTRLRGEACRNGVLNKHLIRICGSRARRLPGPPHSHLSTFSFS